MPRCQHRRACLCLQQYASADQTRKSPGNNSQGAIYRCYVRALAHNTPLGRAFNSLRCSSTTHPTTIKACAQCAGALRAQIAAPYLTSKTVFGRRGRWASSATRRGPLQHGPCFIRARGQVPSAGQRPPARVTTDMSSRLVRTTVRLGGPVHACHVRSRSCQLRNVVCQDTCKRKERKSDHI